MVRRPDQLAGDPALRRQYERSVGRPVVFVDESFRMDPRGGQGFYTMTAVSFPHESLREHRQALLAAGRSPGGRPWHTTEAFDEGRHAQIERMVRLVDEQLEDSIVTVEAPVTGNTGTHQRSARAACLRRLVVDVTRGPEASAARLLVMDQRSERGDADDRKVLALMRGRREFPRGVGMFHSSDSVEPLLQAPDVVGWAMRRQLAVDDGQWLEPIRDRVYLVHASTGQHLDVEKLAQTYNSAGQSADIPTPSRQAGRAQSPVRSGQAHELLPSSSSQTPVGGATLAALLAEVGQHLDRAEKALTGFEAPPVLEPEAPAPERAPDGPDLDR